MHAEQRAERVAVGALVGGEQEAVAVAQLGDDPLDLRRGHDAGGLAHSASASSSSSCEIRIPDSTVGS